MNHNIRYNRVAQLLHWLMAIIIISLILIGFFHDGLPDDMRALSMGLHKSFGMTIFVLTLVRIWWRMRHPAPPQPPMAGWMKGLAHLSHYGFYLLMLAMPVLGYMMSSGGKRPMAWFGVPLPKLPIEKGSFLAELGHEGHEIGGYIIAALVVLHIAAAFYHQLVLKDRLFARMMPTR